jgi:hypothetical protein
MRQKAESDTFASILPALRDTVCPLNILMTQIKLQTFQPFNVAKEILSQ